MFFGRYRIVDLASISTERRPLVFFTEMSAAHLLQSRYPKTGTSSALNRSENLESSIEIK
jgi:hypothetical protein